MKTKLRLPTVLLLISRMLPAHHITELQDPHSQQMPVSFREDHMPTLSIVLLRNLDRRHWEFDFHRPRRGEVH